MEANELKKILAAYDAKLDNNLSLNVATLEKMNLGKSKKAIHTILIYRIIEIIFFSLIVLYLGSFIAANLESTHLVISGIIVDIFAIIALVGSIGQLVLLQQINFSKPIVEIRKKIELVNSHGLLFLKLMFLSAPVWWAYAIVGINIILGFDLYVQMESDFVLRYLIINFLLIFPLVWFLNKLSFRNLHIKWVRKTIGLFAGTKTMKALGFLNDIEKFEN